MLVAVRRTPWTAIWMLVALGGREAPPSPACQLPVRMTMSPYRHHGGDRHGACCPRSDGGCARFAALLRQIRPAGSQRAISSRRVMTGYRATTRSKYSAGNGSSASSATWQTDASRFRLATSTFGGQDSVAANTTGGNGILGEHLATAGLDIQCRGSAGHPLCNHPRVAPRRALLAPATALPVRITIRLRPMISSDRSRARFSARGPLPSHATRRFRRRRRNPSRRSIRRRRAGP